MSAWVSTSSRLAMATVSLVGVVAGKTSGPNYYTAEQLSRARERCRTDAAMQAHVQALRQRVAYAVAMPAAELWRFVPPATLVRATFLWRGQGDFPGCPVCGKEIFKAGGGFYPWLITRDLPWKVTCPSCRTVFPSNDFARFYENGMQGQCDLSGDYPDDGSGWVSPSGLRHYFVGHWCQKQRWQDILQLIDDLGELYRLTEEERYARTCALLLCRFAQVYPDTQYDKQSNYDAQGRILPWCWENTSVVMPVAIAYDSVWPYMRALSDGALREFLAGKGIADPCAHVDRGFLQDVAQKMIHTNQYLSNEGDHQRAFAIVAVVWGNNAPARGITTEQMLQWLAKGRGNLESLVWNDIYADGFPNEASPGYSSAVSAKSWEIARIMARSGHDLFASPRLLATAHVWLDLTVCGQQQPAIGDYGSILGGGRAGWDVAMLRWAWERYREPRFAKALVALGNPPAGLYEPDTRDEIAAVAKAHPGPLVQGTRNLSQFGCAILESHATERPRGLSLYYGSAAGGHGHYDRLNIELYAEGRSLMPDLGYPDQWGAKAGNFHKNSTAHYTVQIDAASQQTMGRGRLHFIADLETVQVVEASAENVYPGLAGTYRRTTALVDTTPAHFYLVDIFRVQGGGTHDWLFHGPPQPGFEIEGVALSEPRAGTLAGADLAVGQLPADYRRSGYEWLHSVREGQPAAGWTMTYPAQGGKAGLRLSMLPGSAQRVFVAQVDSPKLKGAGLPDTLPWLVARNQTSGMSTYVAVIRTLTGADPVETVRSVPVQSRDATGVALQVITADFEDTLYSALDPDAEAAIGDDVRIRGRFVLVRRDRRGRLVSIHAVGAASISGHGVSLTAPAELRGTVSAVDRQANTVTVDGLPPLRSLVGHSVLFSNPLRQTNFQIDTVSAANPRGATLGFGYVSLVAGRGEVYEVQDGTRTLLTDTLWRTHGTMDIWAPGFHPALEGMALVREDGSWRAIIEACKLFPDQPKEWWQPEADHGSFRLAAKGPLSAVWRQGDSYLVEAIVPGDAVSLPTALVFSAGDGQHCRLRTTADHVEIAVPGLAAAALYKPADGSAPARVAAQGGHGVALRAAQLSCGEGILILAPDPGVDYADTAPPVLERLTADGRQVDYAADLDLSSLAANDVQLIFSDANPILPPDIILAGRTLEPGAPGLRVEGMLSRRLTVRLDLPALLAGLTDLAVDYPPRLLMSLRDAAWNPDWCTVRLGLSGLGRPSAGALYLSALEPVVALAHSGLKRDTDYAGRPGLDLRGRHFDRGLLTCPRADGPAEVIYELSAHPGLRTLRAVIGVEDYTGVLGSVTFEVHVDDGADGWKRLYASDTLRGGGAVKLLAIPLGETRRLRLLCTAAGDGHGSDHAAWADARLE